MAAAWGALVWAGYGVPCLVTPLLAPSPWELPLAGAVITGFCAGLALGAWHHGRAHRRCSRADGSDMIAARPG